jgi:hypothetical protein
LLDTALDPLGQGMARRCGVIRTKLVEKRTILILSRFRYHIISRSPTGEAALLAEDMQPMAFTGSPEDAEWLEPEAIEDLLQTGPEANIPHEQAVSFLQQALEDTAALQKEIDSFARQRGEALLDSHVRVRLSAKMAGRRPTVQPNLPADIIGVYVYLPVPKLPGGEGRS